MYYWIIRLCLTDSRPFITLLWTHLIRPPLWILTLPLLAFPVHFHSAVPLPVPSPLSSVHRGPPWPEFILLKLFNFTASTFSFLSVTFILLVTNLWGLESPSHVGSHTRFICYSRWHFHLPVLQVEPKLSCQEPCPCLSSHSNQVSQNSHHLFVTVNY